MLLATPDTVGGIERSRTTSQGTTAWGEATFRCGITPPPPSTDRCVTASGIDWLSLDASDPRVPADATEGAWTFLSYGRVPAVELVIPATAVGTGLVTDVLHEFAPALNLANAESACVGATDLEGDN